MLQFKIQHHSHRGSITAFLESGLVGRIDFNPLGSGVVDLHHTEVAPEFEGRGFGRQLVMAAVAFAKEEGLTLAASCPYAAKILDRAEDVADVWRKRKLPG